MARQQSKMNLVPCSRAFSLLEILVVISIIAILIAILLPALAAAKAESQTVGCLANQREIAQGLVMFSHQHHGYMVKGSNNGYGVGGSTVSDGAYYGAPQVWSYAANPVAPLNWDQILVTDAYVNFGVLQDPADTQDDYLKTGTGQLRYSSLPGTAIASAPIYKNLPGSYRLNSSNQPEYYQGATATNTYESPIYNAYAMASVPDPAESIVLCDGGYDKADGWKSTADVATWAASATPPDTFAEFSSPNNPNTPSAVDSTLTMSTSNINTTIHSGKFNVAYLDGHCATMHWVDTWKPAGQPVIVPASSGATVWGDGGTAPVTTQWRQIFSQDYQDK